MIFWPQVPKCMTKWIPWQLVGDRRDLIDLEKPCAVRRISCGDADLTLIIGKTCRGCRIRTCTFGKDEASPALPQQGKGSKRWQSFGVADSECHEQEWTVWLGLALYVAFSGLYVLLLRPCSAGSNRRLKRRGKHGNWFVAFTLLLPVHIYLWL